MAIFQNVCKNGMLTVTKNKKKLKKTIVYYSSIKYDNYVAIKTLIFNGENKLWNIDLLRKNMVINV